MGLGEVLLLVLPLFTLSTASLHDGCKNYRSQFERVYSVPGDMAMLSSPLLSPPAFNLSAVPYNVTWYRLNSSQPIGNQSGRVLVQEDILWFLNLTDADDGEYVIVVSTPQQCYRQQTILVVDQPPVSRCGRPRTAGQRMTRRVTDRVSCPLRDYINKLDSYGVSYSLTWYKGCELIADTGRFLYWGSYLKVEEVQREDQGLYTCTLHFTMGEVRGSVSETIDVEVKGEYCLIPQVREPANDIVKAPVGSNLTKRCQVFVPCEGMLPTADVYWLDKKGFISDKLSERIYSTQERIVQKQEKGVWLERWLIISELKEEDYHQNYTCRTYSDRGIQQSYFTLQPTDPNLMLPIGLLLSSTFLLFILSISVYYVFKVDLVLWFRRAFPIFYANTGSDGKLYDAYVAYPQKCGVGWSEDLEMFALHTLPEVLEKGCGYKLFITGRDCLPGEAVVDSVEENLQASRRILLLYTASTFSKRYCSNNNSLLSPPSAVQTTKGHRIICHTSEDDHSREQHLDTTTTTTEDHLQTGPESCEDMCPHTRTQLEYVAAMHRALLERSLKVVLVELEELSPSQVEELPESVRHLRQTEGTVCWWRTQRRQRSRWWTVCRQKTEETALTSCLSPDCRFWKEVRYRMPVRGKRAIPPETNALLHL